MGWDGDDTRAGDNRTDYVGQERRDLPHVPVLLRAAEKNFPWKLAGAVLAGVTMVGGWVTTHATSAQDAHASINQRIDKNTTDIAEIKAQLSNMSRTGMLSLQLQLQARLDKISDDLMNKDLPPFARSTLEETRRGLAQQLSEVSRQINGGNQ